MTDAPELDAREKDAHFQGMLLAAEAAESIAPSDEWSEDTRTSYVFGARDAARAIRKIAHMAPTPTDLVREAVKAALEAAAECAYDADSLELAQHGEGKIVDRIRALDPDAIIADMEAPNDEM